MTRVQKSVLVPYSAARMFDLVERIDDYPKFMPWCAGARVVGTTERGTLARIDINYHGVRAHFTTENRGRRPEEIVIELRDGPFRHLAGIWRFRPLSETACKVELELDYEFATHLLERLIGKAFSHVATSFVDSFVRRAEAVYGSASAT
jgi:ribosome-associated toxin RatA of RatAB toxin-antitoxin module